MKSKELIDGENILAIGPRARTRTGRRFALIAAVPFIHPEFPDSPFSSFMGYMALKRREALEEPITHRLRMEYHRVSGERAESLYNANYTKRYREDYTQLADLYLGHLLSFSEADRKEALDALQLPSRWSSITTLEKCILERLYAAIDMDHDESFDELPGWQIGALIQFFKRQVAEFKS